MRQFRIEPGFALKAGGVKARLGGISSIERPESARLNIWNELHVATRRDVLEVGQFCFLAEAPGNPRRNLWPVIQFIPASDVTRKSNSPAIGGGRMKPQAAKRNCDPDDEAVGIDLRSRIPNRVPRVIRTLPFSPQGVGLNSFWIDVKDETVALILESVQSDFYVIIGVKRAIVMVGNRWFPAGQACADALGLIPAKDCDVEVRLIVAEIGFCAFGRRLPIRRMVLQETADMSQGCRRALRRHSVKILKLGCLRNARDIDGDSGTADL